MSAAHRKDPIGLPVSTWLPSLLRVEEAGCPELFPLYREARSQVLLSPLENWDKGHTWGLSERMPPSVVLGT